MFGELGLGLPSLALAEEGARRLPAENITRHPRSGALPSGDRRERAPSHPGMYPAARTLRLYYLRFRVEHV